jgi:hypothetical protein
MQAGMLFDRNRLIPIAVKVTIPRESVFSPTGAVPQRYTVDPVRRKRSGPYT